MPRPERPGRAALAGPRFILILRNSAANWDPLGATGGFPGPCGPEIPLRAFEIADRTRPNRPAQIIAVIRSGSRLQAINGAAEITT